MKRFKLSKNFYLDEYIPKSLYLKWEHSPTVLFGILDYRMIKANQMLRDKFGPVIINNWWHGGDRQWSGFRTPDSPHYSPTSQHSHGRASDKLFTEATAYEVRKYIKMHYKALGITCIEENVDWVHTDFRWTNKGELHIVYP